MLLENSNNRQVQRGIYPCCPFYRCLTYAAKWPRRDCGAHAPISTHEGVFRLGHLKSVPQVLVQEYMKPGVPTLSNGI